MAGTGTKTYFLSHSSGDDGIVRKLREALADLGAPIAVDSREFHGGDPLEAAIRRAIGRSSGVLVLISARAKDSEWVAWELKHALKLQAERGGPDTFPVVPLLLDGTPLGAFAGYFDEEPIHVEIRCNALDEAPHGVLVALRLREPTDTTPEVQPTVEAVEELVLELSDPAVVMRADGSRRANATARLVHEASSVNPRAVHGARFRLEAPLGVIEADELRWYLEDYALWPTEHDLERVRRIEVQLAHWGRLLLDAALPVAAAAEPLKSWSAAAARQQEQQPGVQSARRFSIEIDAAPLVGAPDDATRAAQDAATLLLGLPWELLHDGRSYLFQGANPVRVRRRVPTEHAVPSAVLATPIRVLLASPRPEDEACGYIDHRASARPLVEAIDALAGRVELHLLAPPTLPALREELDCARREGRPYHVLHFDGHGVFDRRAGLGALCFEHAEDAANPGRRRHTTVATPELGALLRDHGIALVFLEACQSAQAESASESVASALLKTGVGSVVAMSHSVLVETSRRFVEAFYRALCAGRRVGSAMLEGQRALEGNPVRGRVFGAGDFTLQDWFVPVLYQDRDDPKLFRETPARQAREDWRERLKTRLGNLPGEPPQGFVGRSRELLALERLLAVEGYAVLCGQGGEGKTALAAEFGRWRVRSRQVDRVAYVSVEQHGDARAVLDAIGRQLVPKDYSVAAYTSLDQAAEPVLRELRGRTPTLLVVDNLESVLAPPFASVDDADEAVAADARLAADAILALCERLGAAGSTRIVFTSREALPAPFDGAAQRVELRRLDRRDAVELVERTLGLDPASKGREAEAKREEIDSLVDAVHGHARTLSLLAPALRERGPAATQDELVALIVDMERRFPGHREQSLLASVELSLGRLSQRHREFALNLAPFQGAVQLGVLAAMTQQKAEDVGEFGRALVAVGLATAGPYRHLTLDPALGPYQRAERCVDEALEARWALAEWDYVIWLDKQLGKDGVAAATLARADQGNLLALLDYVVRNGDVEATVDLTMRLSTLLSRSARPEVLRRVERVRDSAVATLKVAPSREYVRATRTKLDRLVESNRWDAALAMAEELLTLIRSARPEEAYSDADYDEASILFLYGQALRLNGSAEKAREALIDAKDRFERIEAAGGDTGASTMQITCLTELGNSLRDLEHFAEAALAYDESIVRAERAGATLHLAIGKAQLGSLRLLQDDHAGALRALQEGVKYATRVGDQFAVATGWNNIGLVHRRSGQADLAEDCYRRALSLYSAPSVGHRREVGEARTLNELGLLYDHSLGRPEEAVNYFRPSAEKRARLGDQAGEYFSRCNLANALCRLSRWDEARSEATRASKLADGIGDASRQHAVAKLLEAIDSRSASVG